MRKRLWAIFTIIVMCVCSCAPALAEGANYENVLAGRFMNEDESADFPLIVLDAQGPRILITFTQDVYGVELALGGEDMDAYTWTATDSLYRKGIMSAGNGLIVQAYIPDTIPNLRLSFVTQDGGVHELLISDSGMDGSLLLLDAPQGEVSASEAEGLLIARFGEADGETGYTYSWGLVDEIEYADDIHYLFRVSWLVVDEFGAHMSYLWDALVCKSDGEILIGDGAGNWSPIEPRATGDRVRDEWSIDKASTIAQRMARLAADENYLKLFMSETQVLEIAKGASALAGKPFISATVIDAPSGAKLMTIMKPFIGEDYALSPEALNELSKRAPSIFTSIITSRQGVNYVAATAALSVSEVFAAPDEIQNQVIILNYGAELCAIVTLSRTGEAYITATATILPAALSTELESALQSLGIITPARNYTY